MNKCFIRSIAHITGLDFYDLLEQLSSVEDDQGGIDLKDIPEALEVLELTYSTVGITSGYLSREDLPETALIVIDRADPFGHRRKLNTHKRRLHAIAYTPGSDPLYDSAHAEWGQPETFFKCLLPEYYLYGCWSITPPN